MPPVQSLVFTKRFGFLGFPLKPEELESSKQSHFFNQHLCETTKDPNCNIHWVTFRSVLKYGIECSCWGRNRKPESDASLRIIVLGWQIDQHQVSLNVHSAMTPSSSFHTWCQRIATRHRKRVIMRTANRKCNFVYVDVVLEWLSFIPYLWWKWRVLREKEQHLL